MLERLTRVFHKKEGQGNLQGGMPMNSDFVERLYGGRWIAIVRDSIIASDKDEFRAEIKARKIDESPLLVYIPKSNEPRIWIFSSSQKPAA